MREDPAEAMLALAIGMTEGNLDSFITGQEAAGQQEIVHSDVIPTRLIGCSEDDLTVLGFELGDQIEGDPLFRQATLPAGWSREGSEHAMGSYIVDGDGYRRCSIFYKAAFYDRDANLSLQTVYSYVGTCLSKKTVPQVKGDWATRDAVLEALERHRAYNAENAVFWTEHKNAEYVRDHEESVQLCDRFRDALTAEASS
jgi:hypothetical protein